MDFYTRGAAWMTSYIMTNEYIGRIVNGNTLRQALFVAEMTAVAVPLVLHEHAPQVADLLHGLEGAGVMAAVFTPIEQALEKEAPKETQAPEITVDAEPTVAAIEEQKAKPEQVVSEVPKPSQQEIDLQNQFKKEQQELEGTLDAVAGKYFDRYPNLSEDLREAAADTFSGIKAEAMGDLRAQQGARLVELMIDEREQAAAAPPAERPKELDATRDERS